MFSITSFGTLSGLLIGLTVLEPFKGDPQAVMAVLYSSARYFVFTSDYGDHAIDKLNPCGY